MGLVQIGGLVRIGNVNKLNLIGIKSTLIKASRIKLHPVHFYLLAVGPSDVSFHFVLVSLGILPDSTARAAGAYLHARPAPGVDDVSILIDPGYGLVVDAAGGTHRVCGGGVGRNLGLAVNNKEIFFDPSLGNIPSRSIV